jgi:hypothetical protein
MIGAKYILPSREIINENNEITLLQNVLPPIGTRLCYRGGFYRVKDVFFNSDKPEYGWWVVLEDDPAGDPRKAIDPGYYK